MEVNPVVVMFLILIGLSLIGKLVSTVGNFLTGLEKQARERMKQMEAERRALQTGGGGPERPQPPPNELEQLFQMLTGQAPPPQQRQRRPLAARPAVAPPPPMPRRPTRRVERAPELDEEGVSFDEGHGIGEGSHGGRLADHHLLTRVESRVPRAGVADRHIAATLSSAEPPPDESERQARAHAAADMIARLEQLPPLARGVVWSELLGPARWKTGPRQRRSIRRV